MLTVNSRCFLFHWEDRKTVYQLELCRFSELAVVSSIHPSDSPNVLKVRLQTNLNPETLVLSNEHVYIHSVWHTNKLDSTNGNYVSDV